MAPSTRVIMMNKDVLTFCSNFFLALVSFKLSFKSLFGGKKKTELLSLMVFFVGGGVKSAAGRLIFAVRLIT